MTFARRFPAHLLPHVEETLAHLLHNVGEGEWEIVIVPSSHNSTALQTPFRAPDYLKLYVGESDEQPVITQEEHDE